MSVLLNSRVFSVVLMFAAVSAYLPCQHGVTCCAPRRTSDGLNGQPTVWIDTAGEADLVCLAVDDEESTCCEPKAADSKLLAKAWSVDFLAGRSHGFAATGGAGRSLVSLHCLLLA